MKITFDDERKTNSREVTFKINKDEEEVYEKLEELVSSIKKMRRNLINNENK